MKKFLHYDVGEKLGEGKNGSTYVAWDPGLDRVVAIKILERGAVRDEARQSAYLAECERVNNIGSNRLAKFYSLEHTDTRPVIIREFVQGSSIKQLAAGGPVDFDLFLKIAVGAARGLMDLQARDMVHRNITSNNVIYAKEDLIKLVDGHLDATDQSVMSAEDMTYLAPEQLTGGEVDNRSDLYSLGVVLYHLLTGKLPYATTDTSFLKDRILSGHDLFTADEADRYPGDARLLVETLMAVDPVDRLGEADQLLLTLREMIHHNREESEVVTERKRRWRPREYLSVSLLVLLLIVLWFVISVYNR